MTFDEFRIFEEKHGKTQILMTFILIDSKGKVTVNIVFVKEAEKNAECQPERTVLRCVIRMILSVEINDVLEDLDDLAELHYIRKTSTLKKVR